MSEFLTSGYGAATGPLGFPMPDEAAFALEKLLKQQPAGQEFAYTRKAFAPGLAQLVEGERADVSWITTEAVDIDREIVLAAGLDDQQYALNPVVTLNHDYRAPAAGRSLGRWKALGDGKTGIKAKTH